MARFAVADADGSGLSWIARLVDEGNEVLAFIKSRTCKATGDGVFQKTNSLNELLAWAKLKPTTALFTDSGMGSRNTKVPIGADEFCAAGVPVVGGGSIMDRLENDREFGFKVARQAGMRIPPTFSFSSVTAARKFCEAQSDKEWYFKPDNMVDKDTTHGGTGSELADYLGYFSEAFGDNHTNVVQMKIPGLAFSTGAWFNGRVFLQPYEGTIEHKKLMNDEVGPSTGCSVNVVWFYEKEPEIAKELHFNELGQILFQRKCAPGLIDINALIADEAGPWGPKGVPYFLEFTPRLGWDSEAGTQQLLTVKLGEFVEKMGVGLWERAPFDTSRITYGVRLGLSPYPWQSKSKDPIKPSPTGKPLSGFKSLWRDNFAAMGVTFDMKKGYCASDETGCIGVGVATGTSLAELHTKLMKYLKTMKPGTLMYRTDGAKVLAEDAKRLKALGYPTHSGIV